MMRPGSVEPYPMFRQLRHLLELIRFSHTVFALPFALLSAMIAWHLPDSPFQWKHLLGILLCLNWFIGYLASYRTRKDLANL